MERRLIRKRWQITIPREIRRRLNLFEGQLLNFDLVDCEEQVFIRVYTGAAVDPGEMAAFKELFSRKRRKEKGAKCGAKIRKLDAAKKARERRIEAQAGEAPSTSTELQELISNLSGYLLSLQNRLRTAPGG